MLFYSLLVIGIKLEAFLGTSGYNNAGIIPSLQGGSASFSFWWYVPDTWLWPVHIACAVIAFTFCIGFATRFTGPLSWLIAISYANRTMLSNYGLDQILCLALMYLMIAPCGDKLSLDSLIRRLRKVAAPPRKVMANVAARLIQVHFCVIYLFAGLSKLQGETWWNGDAIWNVLANYEYQSVDLTFLAGFRTFTDLVAPTTVLWEISFCVLVWNRYLRPFVLAMGIAMHLGIGAFLGMWTFGLMMCFCYLGFVPAYRIRQVANLFRVFSKRPDWKLNHLSIFGPKDTIPTPRPIEPATNLGVPVLPASNAYDPSIPVLIIVSRSPKLASELIKYFKKYRVNVNWVQDMQLARPLLKETGGILLAFCPNQKRVAELQHWLPSILAERPTTRVVVSASDETPPLPNSEFIPLVNKYREIRKAIELQLGFELTLRDGKQKAKHVPHSPDREMDAALELDTESVETTDQQSQLLTPN